VSGIAVVLVAFLVGYFSRRWVALLLGPAVGAALVCLAVLGHQNPWDVPSFLVALMSTAAVGAGVALDRVARSATEATG
jgi:hypothetical protein